MTTAITIKEYFAERGSPWSNKDALVIGPVLQELSQQGGVTTRDVLDTARSENSPLHPFFEWNDKVAADKFRLETARSMLKSIRVRFMEGQNLVEARAFQVEKKALYEDTPRTYRSFRVLHGDSAFAAQMMDSAFDDLLAWKRKYEPYAGMWLKFGDVFQEVVNQVAEFEDEYRAENVAPETDEALAKLLAWKAEFEDALATWTECRQQIGYIMAAITTAEAVFGKLRAVSKRKCVKCGDEFTTLDEGLRTCAKCRASLTYRTASERVLPVAPLAKQLSGDA